MAVARNSLPVVSPLRGRVARDLYGESLAIAPSANVHSTLAVFRVDPRYAIDHHQPADIVAHSVSALDKSPFVARSSFLSVPRHLFFFDRAPFRTPLLTDDIVVIPREFTAVIRSMCK